MPATISIDAVTAANTVNTGLAYTATHLVSGTNRGLLACYACTSQNPPYNVTFNGVAMLQEGTTQETLVGGTGKRVAIWSLVNPPVGSYNLIASFSVACAASLTIISLANTDQVDLCGYYTASAGTTLTPTLNISSTATEMIIDCVHIDPNATGSLGPQQTALNIGGNASVHQGVSRESGSATVAMTWALSASASWVMAAVNVRPAITSSGGGQTGNGGAGFNVINIDAKTAVNTQNTTNVFTTTHTVNGTNRGLLLFLDMNINSAAHGATYNGAPMTQELWWQESTAGRQVQVWSLIAPAVGTNTLAVSFTVGTACIFNICSFVGVNQTTLVGGFSITAATSTNANLTISATTTDAIVDTVALAPNTGAVPGVQQSLHFSQTNPSVAGVVSTQSGSATVTMSWSFGASMAYVQAAVVLHAEPLAGSGGTPPPPTNSSISLDTFAAFENPNTLALTATITVSGLSTALSPTGLDWATVTSRMQQNAHQWPVAGAAQNWEIRPYYQPGEMTYAPRGDAVPSWWTYSRPVWLYDALSWYAAFEGTGNAASNTRVQVRNIKSWQLSQSTGQWNLVDTNGPTWGDVFAVNGSVYQGYSDFRDESGNGGGVSLKPGGGNFIHGYGNTIHMASNPGVGSPQDVRATMVAIECRLILDNGAGTDDRANARYVIVPANDFWPGSAPDFPGDWPYSPGNGIGYGMLATTNWQIATMLVPNPNYGCTFGEFLGGSTPLPAPGLIALLSNTGQSFPTGVKDNGAAMKLEGVTQESTSGRMTSIWTKTAPATGLHTVVASFSSIVAASMTLLSMANTDQNNLVDFYAGATSPSSNAPNVTVAANTGDLIIDSLAYAGATAGVTGANQTLRANHGTTAISNAVSSKPANASTAMLWSLSAAGPWAQAAVSIRPFGGTKNLTMSQAIMNIHLPDPSGNFDLYTIIAGPVGPDGVSAPPVTAGPGSSSPGTDPGVGGVPYMTDTEAWKRKVSDWIGQANQGHLNNTGTLTLAANAASTTFTDARVGADSYIGLTPSTANAAAEQRGGQLYVIPDAGSFTVVHANNAQTDRTFTYTILG